MESAREAAPDATTDADLLIDAVIAPKLSFATHQNDVPVIRELKLVNLSQTAAEGLVLTAEADPPVFAPREWRFDRIAAGGEVHVAKRDLPLNAGLLLGLSEAVRACVTLSLIVFETTLATGGTPTSFSRAITAANRHLDEAHEAGPGAASRHDRRHPRAGGHRAARTDRGAPRLHRRGPAGGSGARARRAQAQRGRARTVAPRDACGRSSVLMVADGRAPVPKVRAMCAPSPSFMRLQCRHDIGREIVESASRRLFAVARGTFDMMRDLKMRPILAAIALTAIGSSAAEARPGRVEHWSATSETAMAITGDIALSPRALVAAGKTFPLAVAADVTDFATNTGPQAARILRVTRPVDPVLRNGNTLCGAPVRWIAVYRSDGGKNLNMAVFSTPARPRGETGSGVCGTFLYSR